MQSDDKPLPRKMSFIGLFNFYIIDQSSRVRRDKTHPLRNFAHMIVKC